MFEVDSLSTDGAPGSGGPKTATSWRRQRHTACSRRSRTRGRCRPSDGRSRTYRSERMIRSGRPGTVRRRRSRLPRSRTGSDRCSSRDPRKDRRWRDRCEVGVLCVPSSIVPMSAPLLVSSSTLASPLALKMSPALLTSSPYGSIPRVVAKLLIDDPSDPRRTRQCCCLDDSRSPLSSTVTPSIDGNVLVLMLRSGPPGPTRTRSRISRTWRRCYRRDPRHKLRLPSTPRVVDGDEHRALDRPYVPGTDRAARGGYFPLPGRCVDAVPTPGSNWPVRSTRRGQLLDPELPHRRRTRHQCSGRRPLPAGS